MRRGEAEGLLRVSIEIEDDKAVESLSRHYVRGKSEVSQLVDEAVEDSYYRLLQPSIENEFAASSKESADAEAIRIFARNLEQLLMASPLGQKPLGLHGADVYIITKSTLDSKPFLEKYSAMPHIQVETYV